MSHLPDTRPRANAFAWGPALGLLVNALAWGLSWWPLRYLEQQGLHPVWATVAFFALGAVLISLWRPEAWRALRASRPMWALAIAAGGANATFNWGVSIGDVVRVVLLFYLMPLWAALLAWWLLGERITRASAFRMALALLGALLVLWPATGAWPRFDGLADWLGLLGGACFAWTNVLLRQQGHVPAVTRALAMFVGGAVTPLFLGVVLWQGHVIGGWPPISASWLLPVLGMGVVFFVSNLALQYGAARLSVQMTSLIMLSEVLFASASSAAWGDAVITPLVVLGGALILLAAVSASWAADKPA